MSIVRLLSARSTPVPFLDRAEALTRLEKWARSEERFAIHVLGGDGGSGKTRLGVELCRYLTTPHTHRQGAEVWQAGFLQNIEQSDNTSSSDDTSSLLLVIDYAEGRQETVTEVINTALRAAEDPDRRRVRLVFLVRRPSPLSSTRQGSNEWIDVLRPQDSKDEGINLILDEASTIVLNDEKLSNKEREELFEAAYRSFTESPGSPPVSDVLEQLNDPLHSQPLLVTVDAFLSARPLSNSRNSCSPDELFEEVLHHEEKYWKEHWPTAAPFNRELARQAVSAATLADIQDEDDATSLIALLPASSVENTKDLPQWLRHCYPPPIKDDGSSAMWCGHLEPDRIGEHLVASAADDLVPLLQELLSPSKVGTSSLRTWTVLERTSTDPHLNEHVGRILNDVLVEVTQAVHEQTVNSQSPDLAAAFAKLFSSVCSHIDPNKAYEAERPLSESGYFTAFLECELAQCAASIGQPTADAPETDRATYASRQFSFSIRLAQTGRHIEALEAAQEATNLYRTLAKHDPAVYTPDLAASLNNLANRLAGNGQRHEALKTAQEGTNLYRTLAKHNPAAYTPDLAMSLNNLASYLASNGQRHEALKTTQEATNLYRTLAKHNPTAYTPDLAAALNNLAIDLDDNGQEHEALQAAHEATNLYRTLAKHNPTAYTPDLAMSLNNLATYLASNGQRHEALKTTQEATNLYRTLAEHNPTAYTPDLAAALNNLAIELDGNSQEHEALQAAHEATNLYRTLAEHNPAAYTPDLAMSLNNLAKSQAANGQQREALQAAHEATNLYRTLVEHNPAAHTPNLAVSLNNLAKSQAANGQQREALTTAQEATNLYRTLVEHNPAAHTPNLAMSLNTYANILERSGNTKEAARIRKERDEVLKRMKETEEGHV